MQGYGNYPPVYPGYGAQPGVVTKDPTTALLLELIGYAGFLGIGHIYAGRTNRGIALMVSWLFYWVAVGVLAALVVTICISCIMMILWPIVPILSGLWIKNDLDKERAMGMQR
jgi:TM2 domain-containing membrane protein YozV